MADAASPQPIVAVAATSTSALDELDLDGVLLVLDRVRDPGNLGAVLRVAEAAGLRAVVLSGDSTDPFGPKALRASTGSAFRLPIVEVPALGALVGELQERSLRVFATSSHSGSDFAHVDWPDRCAIVLGNESAGLGDEDRRACDETLRIPIAAAVESLNLSVAAGILAMASVRRLQAPGPFPGGSTMQPMPGTETR